MTKEQLTEQIQKECHDAVQKEMKKQGTILNPHLPTEYDIVNQFLLSKLAEMELRIRKLETTTVRKLADD